MANTKHYSVMKDLAINYLNIKEDGIYVDATLGYAGDSSEILKRIKKGYLFAFDADTEAIQYSHQLLSQIGSNFTLIHANFANLKVELNKANCQLVDGFLFDLGLSSPEIDDPSRGFTFMTDAPLDMRMNQEEKISAKDIVNNYSYSELLKIFYDYSEERLSPKIAHAIVTYREKKAITHTLELVDIIKTSVGANYFYKHHPERVIFQALRIEVNHELESLKIALTDAIKMLKPSGRICIITFHSLEDRIVKNIFKKYSEVNPIFKGMPSIPQEYQPLIKIITKKPLTPSPEELNINSRSRSAKMRVVERI